LAKNYQNITQSFKVALSLKTADKKDKTCLESLFNRPNLLSGLFYSKSPPAKLLL